MLNIILYGDYCIIEKVKFNGGDKIETKSNNTDKLL